MIEKWSIDNQCITLDFEKMRVLIGVRLSFFCYVQRVTY
jgi:hypothetical protein